MKITIVVDVFRAATTASYVLKQEPATYCLTNKSCVIARLVSSCSRPFPIGKSEIGADFSYMIPNSPTRVKEFELKGHDVLHRTEAAAMGVLQAQGSDLVLLAGFVNADVTAAYVKTLFASEITIRPMGHEGKVHSLEDDLCAQYINALINGEDFDFSPFKLELQKGPGKYFFLEDQKQYPRKDFDRCLKIRRFNFVIIADVQDDYAILCRRDIV